MSVNQVPNFRQRLIWSSIRNRLNLALHDQNLINLIKVQDTQERLEKFLSFYTEGNKNENLPQNLKFLNRFIITPSMRDFIINIAECLNMTKINCFELLDNYFYLYNDEYDKISKLLSLFMNYQDKSSRRYENIITDLEDKRAKIIEFYFKERKNLILFYLDIFYKIFLEIDNTPLQLKNIMENIIKTKQLVKVFYSQLINYGDNDDNNNINNIINNNLNNKIFNQNKFINHYVRDLIKNVPVYLCEEQNMILELIMILLNQRFCNDLIDSNIFEGLFNYFLKTQFYCYSQNLNSDYNNLKDQIMIKSLIITLKSFQPEIINEVEDGETNKLNNILCLKNYFNILLKIYEQPINNHILSPIKMTISCIINLVNKHRNLINNSNEINNKFNNAHNTEVSERECFAILNIIDQKIQLYEEETNADKKLTIYDIFYDILYEWLNAIMNLFYDGTIEKYELQLYSLLFRVLSHFFPQKKFYSSLFNHKSNNITDLFNTLKIQEEKRNIFLNLCFSLSKSIEPGEGSDNNEYLLKILFSDPIEELIKKIDECEDDINQKQIIIEEAENNIFFYNIIEEWRKLIQELLQYIQLYQNQMQNQIQDALPDELSNQINYIRLFIRSVLPNDCFSNFIFNYSSYINIKEKSKFNDNNIDEEANLNFGAHSYNPEIFKSLIIDSATVLNIITELQIPNKNILFGKFISELLKLFILYSQDPHFTECLKNMNYFFEKFNGKSIVYNIIVNDNNTQDFSNTLYAVKFIRQMFKPDIFLVVSRNSDYNAPNKFGEIFYVSNFYYIKELINHFTQVNDYLTPLNALIIAELAEIMSQIMNYLEFKNNYNKIDIEETQNVFYENKNLADFIIKLLVQDNKDYVIEDNSRQSNNSNSLLLIDFIFKYIGIKIKDQDIHNFDIDEIRKNIYYNNTYVQLYLNKNNINKENYNMNNSYNMSCYKKMILNIMNCLNKILSLIIILQRKENIKDKKKENKNDINKYKNIYFINKLYRTFIDNKEVPQYIYESIDNKRKYNFSIVLLLLFYSLYEVEKKEQLLIERKHIINLEEELPNDLYFFMIDLKEDTHLNVSTSALNSLTKIIYIIKDTGININKYFALEEISSSELNTNINLFKYIRYKLINILGSPNINIDLLKLEILKFLIISTKYQPTFIRDFIQGNDDIRNNNVIFNNLNQSLKVNYNFNNDDINNNEIAYDLKIDRKTLRAELFTYIIMFISELLNETQDLKIIESLLIKDNGIMLINNLIHYGIHSCDISKDFDEFYKILVTNLNNSKNNISDILFISNSFKVVIDVFCLKLNIIRSLSMIFKRILLISKKTKNLTINFKYSKELKFFIQIHISSLIQYFSKTNEYDYIKIFKNLQQDLEINGLQLKQKYLVADNYMNNENLEMIIENYLYRYDYNYCFDIKELIIKGFYDKIFREKHLKNIVINNSFICYNSILVQTLTQSAHLFGLIFSIGDYNYLLTNKLFSDAEIYKIFKDSLNDNQLTNSCIEEINSILNYDNCYNYKLTFNPLDDLGNKNENNIIKFIKDNIIDKSINVQNIPNLTLDSHRLYYQMLNCSFDYIIYLHNKSVCSPNSINIKIDLFDFLKKVISILNDGVINKTISDTNLLSAFNLIHHLIYYLVLTEKTFDSSNQNNDNEEIINNIIINDDNDKIEIIISLMDVLIMVFKKIKDSRSLLLYIFSTIVYIKNEALKNPIMELFNIIIKLYTKENDSFEFHSFLLLLNRLKINYPILLMDILKDPQIFNFIAMKCGYNLDITLYQNKEHNSGHLIYCWTLNIFETILDTYLTKISTELKPHYNNVITYCMKFIELIQQRFKELFNICINNENFISGLNQNNNITLAYLDELKASIKFINSFIDIECDNTCPSTKDQSFLEFLFDSVDLIANTCLYLFKNGYQQIFYLCKPNSRLEDLMINTKITKKDINENNNNNLNLNNINNFNFNQFSFGDDNNIYRNLLNNNINNNNRNNNDGNNNSIYEDKTANVFHFKIKSNLIMILFHISSSMIKLLNRQNFNLKQYFFNKYQLKENENQLNNWPMLYLNSIKFSIDFLKDIIMNIKKYKLLYNKSLLLMNSINISFSNCFINNIDPEYPLNELVDLILFILNDFCNLTPNFKEFIELIVKNHPYINNNKAILGDISQLIRRIDNEIENYSSEFEDEDNFIGDYKDLKNAIEDVYKIYEYKFKN